jgi:probable rRNA maturation factor
MEIKIEKSINASKWYEHSDIIDMAYLERVVTYAILGSKYHNLFEEVELAITFTDNNEISQINKEFRGKNGPTNIISLQVEDFINYNKKQYVFLGDIIVSIEKIEQETQEEEKTFFNHCSHLIVHGVLHLLGYNHKLDKEQKVMESIEVEVLKNLGLTSPY